MMLTRTMALGACALLLAGCGGTGQRIQDTLGLTRQAPDEFRVVQRAPLVVPPDYNLRPPRPGEPRPQEPAARDQARAVLTGQAAPDGTGALSSGESVLLGSAGHDQADPEIRRQLAEDRGQVVLDESQFLMILPWQRERMERQAGEAIDPRAEAERLRVDRLRRTPLEPEGTDS
jgi:hypothetical protein